MDLAEVQRALAAQKQGWEAGRTPIGERLVAPRNAFRGFGYTPKGRQPGGGRGALSKISFAFETGQSPSELDWRAVRNENWAGQVADQGSCGSCVAFATVAVLEARRRIRMRDAHLNEALSVAHLFFCGTKNGCEQGWTPALALDRCRKVGVGLENNFRYRPEQLECRHIPSAVMVPRWRKPKLREDRMEALALRGPVIGCMHVFEDFLWYRSGVYRPVSSRSAGLHAVAVVGYNDAEGCWLIKNSWGTAWGEGGFARLGYGTCGIDTEFPFYDPEVEIAAIAQA